MFLNPGSGQVRCQPRLHSEERAVAECGKRLLLLLLLLLLPAGCYWYCRFQLAAAATAAISWLLLLPTCSVKNTMQGFEAIPQNQPLR